MIEVFPVILRHEAEGTEQREAEIVEARVAVVRVRTDPNTRVVDRTPGNMHIGRNHRLS